MAEKRWSVKIGNKSYDVVVEWSRWSNAGEVRVDGSVVKAWGSGSWVPREVEFAIEQEKAFLRRKGLLVENWDLYVGGKRY